MYNEFGKNITKESNPVRQKALYNEKNLIGRLYKFFVHLHIYRLITNSLTSNM